jgi:GMP synthase (glutamine-hydrolysing)
MASILAIQHLAFEDLGVFGDVFARAGHSVAYVNAWHADWAGIAAAPPDVLAVLGGPIGVYEGDRYPFLQAEIAAIAQRLGAGLPVLGICLGAQLMAAALGARVYPSGGKEIGFAPLGLTAEGARSVLADYQEAPMALHWHGDTFDLPRGAQHLAFSAATPHQAFSVGGHGLAFQFHPELDPAGLEAWLVGHTCELTQAGLDVRELRRLAQAHGPAMRAKGERVAGRVLAQFGLSAGG